MNILIYVLYNSETGLGHFVRMQALAQAAVMRGHRVWVASDGPARWPGIFPVLVRAGNLADLRLALGKAGPAWVVIDVPGKVPVRFLKPIKECGAKICLIDGVGHPASRADLVISQGPEGDYCAPDHLLLRSGLFRYRWSGAGFQALVWGGATDPLGLIPAYCGAFPDSEALVFGPRFGDPTPCPGNHWLGKMTSDDGLFGFMATCRKAVVSCGMIVHELAALGVPTYVFSRTERHLKTALAMQEAGYLLAWPEVGLPGLEQFVQFVRRPFEPSGKRPDGRGPERVCKLLEENA